MGLGESKCSLNFWVSFENEWYDVVNIVPFYIFFFFYQFTSIIGMFFPLLNPIAIYLKLVYQFYRHVNVG